MKLVLPPVVAVMLAIALADILTPPEGHGAFDHIARDVFELLIGIFFGVCAAWLLYGRGRRSG